MRDVIDFASPGGPVGYLVDRILLRRYMPHLIKVRNAYLAGTFG